MSIKAASPVAFVAPAILALGAGAIVFALAQFWGANPDNIDRLLIIGAAAWIAWQARPDLLALPARPSLIGYVPLLIGTVAFPVGWFLFAQVGPKPILLWWLGASWVLATAGYILATGGWSRLRRLAFPLGFLLFALPIPNRVLIPLQEFLQSHTTTIAAWALEQLGTPVTRNGFILSLPGGDLEVAEACSGVRSVTALTAIAAFVAWWNGFRFLRGLALVALSIPVIGGVNAIRVIASGLIQEYFGAEYVRGQWHEGLGIVMVLLGLGLIVLLARVVGWGAKESSGEITDVVAASPSRSIPQFASALLILSAFATITAQFLGMGAEKGLATAAPLEQIPLKLGRWDGIDVPIEPDVTATLTPDAMQHRVYTNLGYEIDSWVIFWTSKNMVKGYHHPDVCWPSKGFELVSREVVPIAASGGTVPITVREFARGTDRQLILYWTQEGRRIWTEEDEERVKAVGDSHDWLGERLLHPYSAVAKARLQVLTTTRLWGDGSTIRPQMMDFTQQLANDVYRVCPWAAPAGAP